MAFPTIDTTPTDYAHTVFVRAKQIRAACVTFIAQCDTNAININDVAVGFMAGLLGPVKVELTTIALVSGLFEELQRQKPNAFADAAAAQTAYGVAQAAITTLISFIEDNIPVDGSRRLLSMMVSSDDTGTLTQRTITTAGPIASFRSALVACRDAFDA